MAMERRGDIGSLGRQRLMKLLAEILIRRARLQAASTACPSLNCRTVPAVLPIINAADRNRASEC